MCRGVNHFLSLLLTVAPCSKRVSTTAMSPLQYININAFDSDTMLGIPVLNFMFSMIEISTCKLLRVTGSAAPCPSSGYPLVEITKYKLSPHSRRTQLAAEEATRTMDHNSVTQTYIHIFKKHQTIATTKKKLLKLIYQFLEFLEVSSGRNDPMRNVRDASSYVELETHWQRASQQSLGYP